MKPVSAKLNVNIDAKIPAKSSGKLVEATARFVNAGAGAVEAITDLVRPLTEWTGLKGDRLRLQREEVALEIAERASAKVRASKKPLTPIPTKTVVRLLEGGSLEEPTDTTMIDLWANLLASAAQDSNAATPRFISILEDLNGAQANTLRDVVLGKNQLSMSDLKDRIVYDPPISERVLIYSAINMSAAVCQYKIEIHIKENKSIDDVFNFIEKMLATPGISYHRFAMGSYNIRKHLDDISTNNTKIPENYINYEILTNMGLLSKEKVGPFLLKSNASALNMTFTYFRITPLGLSFIRAVSADLVAWDAETL